MVQERDALEGFWEGIRFAISGVVGITLWGRAVHLVLAIHRIDYSARSGICSTALVARLPSFHYHNPLDSGQHRPVDLTS